MNVSDQIIQVLDALCEKFGLVIDWTSENVLPYLSTLCTKLVSYEIWTSVAWMSIMIVMSIASVIVTKRLVPIFKDGLEKDRRNYDVGWGIGTGLSIFGLCILYLATIVVIVTQIMDIIQCVTFPEMFIFEYVQRVLNSGG